MGDGDIIRSGDDASVIITLPPRPPSGYSNNGRVEIGVVVDAENDLARGNMCFREDAYINPTTVEISGSKANWIYQALHDKTHEVVGEKPILDRYNNDRELQGHVARVFVDELVIDEQGFVDISGNMTPGRPLDHNGAFLDDQLAAVVEIDRHRQADKGQQTHNMQQTYTPEMNMERGEVENFPASELVMLVSVNEKGEIDPALSTLWFSRGEGENEHVPIEKANLAYTTMRGNAPWISEDFFAAARRAAGDDASFHLNPDIAGLSRNEAGLWVVSFSADAQFDGVDIRVDNIAPSKSGYRLTTDIYLDQLQAANAELVHEGMPEYVTMNHENDVNAGLTAEDFEDRAVAEPAGYTDVVNPFGGGSTYNQFSADYEKKYAKSNSISAKVSRMVKKAANTLSNHEQGMER